MTTEQRALSIQSEYRLLCFKRDYSDLIGPSMRDVRIAEMRDELLDAERDLEAECLYLRADGVVVPLPSREAKIDRLPAGEEPATTPLSCVAVAGSYPTLTRVAGGVPL